MYPKTIYKTPAVFENWLKKTTVENNFTVYNDSLI